MATRAIPASSGSPLLFTFGSFGLWALLLVASRVILVRFDLDPWSFAFVQLMAGGIVLIARSTGGEPADWSSLRRVRTWLYGALRVASTAAYTAALVHATVTHTGMLGTNKVVLGVVGASLAFGRRPVGRELGGHLAILAGIGLLATTRLDGGARNPAVALVLLSDLAVVASSLIAEAHPDNNADNPAVRLRFSGTVLLITAGLFLVFRLLQEGVASGSAGFGVGSGAAVWIAGLLVGVALRGPAMHCSLKAIRLAGADVYLMVAPSLVVAGLAFETIATALGLLDRATFGAADLALLCLIACGVGWVVTARRSASAAPRDAENRVEWRRPRRARPAADRKEPSRATGEASNS